MDYNELNLSTERPCRFSGTEVVGWGLEQEAIAGPPKPAIPYYWLSCW